MLYCPKCPPPHFLISGFFLRFSVENVEEKQCYESQIIEFGQTPKQLFTKPHPKKLKNLDIKV